LPVVSHFVLGSCFGSRPLCAVIFASVLDFAFGEPAGWSLLAAFDFFGGGAGSDWGAPDCWAATASPVASATAPSMFTKRMGYSW